MNKKKEPLTLRLLDKMHALHAGYTSEIVILATYHSLKYWERRYSQQKLTKKLILEIEAMYFNIQETNPPYELDLNFQVHEWIEERMEDYDFGCIIDERFKKLSDLILKDNYNLATIDGKKAIEKKRGHINTIDQVLFKSLPVLDLPILTCNYDQEVARQINEAIKDFWYPENIQTIGVAQRYNQFKNNVLKMAMDDDCSLYNADHIQSLSTFLFLFQYLELGGVYSKESCMDWAYYLTSLAKHIDGHKKISHSRFWLMGTTKHDYPDALACIDNFCSLVKKVEPYITGNASNENGYVTAKLWQYPNKEATSLTLDVKKESIDILNHRTHEKLNNLSFDEAQKLLQQYFID